MKDLIASRSIRSVLDIGCGHLSSTTTKSSPLSITKASIFSEVVVEKNKAACPGLRFRWHDISIEALDVCADLVICFNVLIHQLTESLFRSALTNIMASIVEAGLISYKTPPPIRRRISRSWPQRRCDSG